MVDDRRYQVFPYSVALGHFSHPVNAYLLAPEAGDAVLVDTGPDSPAALAALEEALQSAGLSWSSIRHILLTHGHNDHNGLSARILERTPATVWIHGLDRSKLSGPSRSTVFPTRHAMESLLGELGVPAGSVQPMVDMSLDIDIGGAEPPVPAAAIGHLEHGMEFALSGLTLEVLHGPGHTFGSCCFYDRAGGVIFSGDTALPDITPVLMIDLFVESEAAHMGLSRFRETMELLRQLPVTVAYPGHGSPIADFGALIDTQLSEITKRSQRVLAALGGRRVDSFTLAAELFPRATGYHQFLAVCEVAEHAHWLAHQGLVGRSERSGVWLWEKA